MVSQTELRDLEAPRRVSGYHPEANVHHEEPVTGSEGSRQEFSLPPADRGKEAYLFLAGCFAIEALVWGFPFSFGVFQEYYATHEPFANEGSTAVIGTTATGIMYLSGPIMFTVLGRWPRLQRPANFIGLPILVLGIVAASFAQKVWQLILTQGIIYAIGGAFLYCPTILYLEEWFVARKGLAFGIMWAGTGVSGAIIPFVASAGLSRFGYQTVLRAWAVAMVVLIVPVLRFVKPRLPKSSNTRSRPNDLRFLQSPIFWTLELCNIVEGLGYFIPGIYLPTYANLIGSPSFGGPLSLALFNGASVFGAIGMGWLVDRLHVTTVMLLVSIAAALSVFIAWGLSVSLPVLAVFSLLYGLSAGGFSATWAGMIKETQIKNRGADSGVIFGLLAAGRGIGAVASGPLSTTLLSTKTWLGTVDSGYGSGYGSLIVFTGTTAAAGSIAWGFKRIGWI